MGAEKVLALCPCCEFQLRVSADKKKMPIEVVDLARFAASALGYEFPDPNPEVHRQWAVFEAMIALMTPQGFANLMGTMWPEMIDAMPFGMGPMMRVMGKIPGARADETDVPHPFPQAAAHDDAEGDADHAQACRRPDPHAGLHAGADAETDAQGDGQSDAPHDRRCCAAGYSP